MYKDLLEVSGHRAFRLLEGTHLPPLCACLTIGFVLLHSVSVPVFNGDQIHHSIVATRHCEIYGR